MSVKALLETRISRRADTAPHGDVTVCPMDGNEAPSFFYAVVSFSSPGMPGLLCKIFEVSHVFSRGCCSARGPHGLSMA
jgi:hypothetical protein